MYAICSEEGFEFVSNRMFLTQRMLAQVYGIRDRKFCEMFFYYLFLPAFKSIYGASLFALLSGNMMLQFQHHHLTGKKRGDSTVCFKVEN